MSYPMFQRDEFKQWLMSFNNLPAKTAESYVSYVAGANHQFIIEGLSMCKLIEKYSKEDKPLMIDAIISNVHNQLYRLDICKITGKAKGTIENWRTGLLTYKEFFCTTTDEVDEEETINDVLEAELKVDILCNDTEPEFVDLVKKANKTKTRTYLYTANNLMANFTFRMITQDRFYGDIFFPVSYLKRFMHRNGQKKYFDKWISDQINDINILCANETHKFKDISELKLEVSSEHSEVTITVKNTKEIVFSPTAFSNELFPLSSSSLKRIAIDHIHPMKKILMDNIKMLPQLGIITGQLKGIAQKANAKEFKAAGTVLLNQPLLNQIDIELLKIELDLIKSNTKLQLMDKIENLKKRAN